MRYNNVLIQRMNFQMEVRDNNWNLSLVHVGNNLHKRESNSGNVLDDSQR